jgi:hypothetical protein
MESDQRLPVFLPRLHAALLHLGFSKSQANSVCHDIRAGNPPKPILNASQYHRAWAICDAMEDILTTLDDGSEAATWCSLIAHRIFDYQDAFKAKHGYMPLDPGPIEQVSGPVGRA